MSRALRLLVSAGFATFVACAVAEIPGQAGYVADIGDGTADGAAMCVDDPKKLEKVDVNTLQPCQCKAGGKAHCIASEKLPQNLAAPLAECQGTSGRCVPDSIIETSGAPLPTCRTSGDEGRCVTLCVPKVEKYAEALTRGDGDTCAIDEKCVPCRMPDGSSSGICEIGLTQTCASSDAASDANPDAPYGIACPYSGTKMSVTQMPVCAPGGRCVSEPFLETAVTDDNTRQELKARLANCTLDAGLGYCMPEEYLRNYGQYKPPQCRSFAGIEGRCFSTVFKDVDAQKDLLPRDICEDISRCIPCFNPADGAPSGACTTVSCDDATTNPPNLRDCCMQGDRLRGKCIPKNDIPQQFQSRLTWYECDSDTELCVPSENVDLKSVPATCVPQTTFPPPQPTNQGVCVSRCLVFSGIETFEYQSSTCAPEEICAPCTHPTNGQPTHAPGCKY